MHPDLEALRREIDAIDAKILQLIAARVRVVLKVGDLKRTLGATIYDPERERQMLERLSDHVEPPLDRDTVKRIFERLIDESRRIEQRHVSE
jgi:chorismate mutase